MEIAVTPRTMDRREVPSLPVPLRHDQIQIQRVAVR